MAHIPANSPGCFDYRAAASSAVDALVKRPEYDRLCAKRSFAMDNPAMLGSFFRFRSFRAANTAAERVLTPLCGRGAK
jgi:hypothetical protein